MKLKRQVLYSPYINAQALTAKKSVTPCFLSCHVIENFAPSTTSNASVYTFVFTSRQLERRRQGRKKNNYVHN